MALRFVFTDDLARERPARRDVLKTFMMTPQTQTFIPGRQEVASWFDARSILHRAHLAQLSHSGETRSIDRRHVAPRRNTQRLEAFMVLTVRTFRSSRDLSALCPRSPHQTWDNDRAPGISQARLRTCRGSTPSRRTRTGRPLSRPWGSALRPVRTLRPSSYLRFSYSRFQGPD